MIRDCRLIAFAGAAALSLTVSAPIASAEVIKLTIASSHPTVVPWVGVMKSHVVPESNKRLKAMGSKYTIKWTQAYGGTLYKFQNTLEAVEQRLTDVGWVGTLWESSKMPLQNVTFHTPFVTNDLPALLKLFNELHAKDAVLRQAWLKQNQVFLGASGIETYHILTKFPFNKVSDLKGKKILAAGPVGSWLKGTGAIPVNGGLPGFYNMIKTGVADGAVIAFSGAYPFKLYEVAPYVTKVGLGAQYTGGMAINKDTWDKLPPEVQKVLKQLGQEYSSIQAKKLMFLAGVFEKKMAAAGAKISTLPAAEKQKWVKNMPNLGGSWVTNTSAKGLPAKALLSAYMAGVRQSGGKPLRDWDK